MDRPGAPGFYLLRIFIFVYTDSNIGVSGGKQGGSWSRTGTEAVRLFCSGKGGEGLLVLLTK